jgi:hypothetical protein
MTSVLYRGPGVPAAYLVLIQPEGPFAGLETGSRASLRHLMTWKVEQTWWPTWLAILVMDLVLLSRRGGQPDVRLGSDRLDVPEFAEAVHTG